MDPTECLKSLLSNLEDLYNEHKPAVSREEAIHFARVLAQWLENGGFAPNTDFFHVKT